MNQLLGASIAGIKCKAYMVSPLTRILTLVQTRSVANCKVSEFPVGPEERKYPPFIKDKSKAKRELWFGSAFTGEVEKRYLDYLGKLDWESLNNHIIYFPRKHRSKDEKWLIFDKWAAHHGRKYPSIKLKKMRYATFKKRLDINDECNSLCDSTLKLGKKSDIFGYPITCYVPCVSPYWLKGFRKPYLSYTPPDFCELEVTCKKKHFFGKKR